MRITPGPGTAVVIVQRRSEGNIARIGNVSGNGDVVTSDSRADLPEIAPGEQVAFLAKVASQKMIAHGILVRTRDGADQFNIRGSWQPADNRKEPRLAVSIPVEVRARGGKLITRGVIEDISSGGTKAQLDDPTIFGDVEIFIRYGGFSATLSATIVSEPDDEAPDQPTRMKFTDLAAPQQRFLRHMLHDLAELSGWELAS